MKDSHLHSGFLDHTKDDIDSIVETANELGFDEIAITEHFIWYLIEHPKPITDDDRDTLFVEKSQIPNDARKTTDLQTYVKEIDRVAAKYSMKVLKGLEVDYFSQYENDIRNVLKNHKFDVLLGSSHYICDEELPESEKYLHLGFEKRITSFIEKYGINRVYELYFENISNAIRSGLFDYIAHIDFIKKAIPNYSKEKAFSYIYPILELMIKEKVGLEINLKGIKKFQEPFPSHEVIDAYKNLGGKKISIGSDAHSVKQLIQTQPLIKSYEKKFIK